MRQTQRKPYRRFQYATASLLKCEVSYLWPDERTSAEVTASGNAELVQLYPHRSVVAPSLWTSLYAKATRQFDVLVYSGFWLTEDAAFHRIVKEKNADGVPIRFMLGEPSSAAVAVRGEDEGIGTAMAGKIRNALINYGPLFGLPGVEFRLHGTTLYNSLYRADDELLANGHLYGVGAYMAPVLHLATPSECAQRRGNDSYNIASDSEYAHSVSPMATKPTAGWSTSGGAHRASLAVNCGEQAVPLHLCQNAPYSCPRCSEPLTQLRL
ncbi:XRE family transcriptional regulator [Streptomyces cellulosae]